MSLVTSAPAKDVLLYDGHCRICVRGIKPLRRWLDPQRTDVLSFREQGALDRFPGVTLERCEQAMQLVRQDGRVFQGAEAIVQALRCRMLGKLAFGYYLPGVRQLSDALYRYVARRRFELAGRAGECDAGGSCQLHRK